MARPIVLDTDLGSDVDDALALALALASPEVFLLAVTTVSGDVRRRAAIAHRLLELAGRSEVPVYPGMSEPLGSGPGFVWFGVEGDGILTADDNPRFEGLHAVDALAEIIQAWPGLEIVAIGPLTNIAALIRKAPHLVRLIGRLTVMGGHVRRVSIGRTELPHGVDYNLCSDPQASITVLHAGVPIRLVTVDASFSTWITTDDVEMIATTGSQFHAALGNSAHMWTPIMQAIFHGFGVSLMPEIAAFLHDPLTVACAIDESFCNFEELAIEPAIVGGVFRTIERDAPMSVTIPLRCATAVDAARFRTFFLDRVCATMRAIS